MLFSYIKKEVRLLKRIVAFLLTLALLLCALPLTAFAEGEEDKGSGNLDGGSGGMGTGSENNYWNPGMDGVRVTVIDAETGLPATVPIDFTNQTPVINAHFGKRSKIHYRNGAGLSVVSDVYSYENPATPIPQIISTGSSKASIAAIKRYFCSSYVAHLICDISGMHYENLISGRYKLLLEPIAYLTYSGINFAMTAHEAAMYDNQVSGNLRVWMVSLSHKNLPLSMFLEYPDLGFPAYGGSTSSAQSNDTIISQLGVGIVRYVEEPPEIEETDFDYEYRTDTDVITPVTLYASGEINPDAPASVTFRVGGSSTTVNNIVIPAGESQLVWFKWHTPSEPQDMVISVSSTRGSVSQSTIRASVVDLSGNDPPDPKATDTAGSWTAAATPGRDTQSAASWSVWYAVWHPYWVWHSDGEGGGYYCDHGWWDFFRNNYTARLTVAMTLAPDDKAPTASGGVMKSGYGVKTTVTAAVSSNAPASHYTFGQTAVSYFPEFRYVDYWRLLDLTRPGATARFEFAENIYSTYNRRAHFVPVWFPDGRYTANTHLMDVWTPDGMLSANLNASVTISGSVYDDWHIGVRE